MEKNENKGIMSEALIDIDLVTNALNENTKEILRAIAIEEIDGVIKESLNEDFEEDDIEDVPVDGEGGDVDDVAAGEPEGIGVDIEADPEGGEELEIGAEPEGIEGVDGLSSDMDSEVDLTGASDSEVIAVYKELSMSDEIEVVGDEVHMDIREPGKYIIKPEGGAPAMDAPMGGLEEPMGEPEMGGLEEPMGEPEMGIEEPEMGGGEPELDAPMDAPIGEPEGEEDEVEVEEEGVVYEISINEGEGAHYEHMGETTPPNSGDIDSQTSKELPSDLTGDNLVGGFGEAEAKNGSGDAHAEHVMGAEGKTDPTAKTKATALPAEEKTEAGKGGSSDGAHGSHVMEGEEIEEGAVTEDGDDAMDDDDILDEKIQVGKGRNVTNNKTEIEGAGGAANNVNAPNVTANSGSKNESTLEYRQLVAESNKLKEANRVFVENLKFYKKALAETVVFNSNLTQVVKLFLEHSTTKNEKKSIIKRFDDEVKSLKESKQLYNKVNSELTAQAKSLNESVGGLDRLSSTGSAQLNEQNVYVANEKSRTLQLMERVDELRTRK